MDMVSISKRSTSRLVLGDTTQPRTVGHKQGVIGSGTYDSDFDAVFWVPLGRGSMASRSRV